MRMVEVRNARGDDEPRGRGASAFEAGSAAAGCGFGCIREIIWTGLLLLAGYLLLSTCTGL